MTLNFALAIIYLAQLTGLSCSKTSCIGRNYAPWQRQPVAEKIVVVRGSNAHSEAVQAHSLNGFCFGQINNFTNPNRITTRATELALTWQ